MNKFNLLNKTTVKGVVTRRLFDTEKLGQAKKYLEAGFLTNEQKVDLLNWASKPQFADNWLWKVIKKVAGIDLKIPFITGYWTNQAVKANLVTTVGKKAAADQLGGTTTAPMTAVAIGIGATAANAADTTLGSEITTNGGERGAATVSNATTTTTGDTERWIKTFSFTGSFAVTEEGILNNNTSGGVLLARQVFSAINVISGDSLQVTHNIQVT